MISAIILTHNSGKTIKKAITSVSWCDEVIVVDDFSTDDTEQVANKSSVIVHKHHLHNDFSAQRNFGLSVVKGDWVLFVDADEVVPSALAREIGEAIQMSFNGFYVKRQDVLFGKKLRFGETSRVRLLRLAKRHAGQWVRPVHEVWNVSGKVGTLTNALDHFPHPDVAQFITDINEYSTINAVYLYNKKCKVTWWHIIAYPVAKFLVDYIWFMGFRDGTPGAIIAITMSMHSFLTRAKLWLLWRRHE